MTTPENPIPKKNIKKWQIAVIVVFVLFIIGQFTGSKSTPTPSSPTTTTKVQRADTGTHMACEHWRINLSNSTVETLEQQIAGAQKVNYYASVSTNPVIVSNAKAMTEAFIQQDSEAYLKYATAFGSACVAAGE